MDQQTLSLLIKVGEQKHIEALYRRGEVLMNSLPFFQKEATDRQRKDISEGASQVDQVNWMKITGDDFTLEIGKDDQPIKLTSGQIREYDPNRSGNIYSMIGLDPLFIEQVGQIDERNTEFGDLALLILKPKVFIDRMVESIQQAGHHCVFGKVSYYDAKEYSGPLNVYQKPLTYAHQSEFRFFIPNLENKPLKFNIDSLEGIAKMIPAQDLPKLRFDYVQKVA